MSAISAFHEHHVFPAADDHGLYPHRAYVVCPALHDRGPGHHRAYVAFHALHAP